MRIDMKRVLLIVAALFTLASTASAQTFGDLLKSGATQIIDKVTGGKATELMLTGTWSYNAPAVKFTGDNELANVAGNALASSAETKLQKAYDFVGIKQGSCTFTFKDDNSFTAVIGKRNLSGTYTYDAATHAIELNFSTLLKLSAMKGFVYLEGESLSLVFDCSRLTAFVKTLGAKVSMLKGVTSLLSSYDDVMLGFGFNK